eukprot:6200780-Pleurochrysis_carterae.AAC.4
MRSRCLSRVLFAGPAMLRQQAGAEQAPQQARHHPRGTAGSSPVDERKARRTRTLYAHITPASTVRGTARAHGGGSGERTREATVPSTWISARIGPGGRHG